MRESKGLESQDSSILSWLSWLSRPMLRLKLEKNR
jgi:hypothetical protein